MKGLKRIFASILLCFAAAFTATAVNAAGNNELDVVRENYRQYYNYNVNDATAKKYCESQLSDGTWEDIDYGMETPGLQAWEQLRRLYAIAVSANTEGHYLNQNRELANTAIEKGLVAWKEKVPSLMDDDGYLSNTTYWWNNTIGTGLAMMPIVASSYGHISDEAMDIAMEYLFSHKEMKNYPDLLTGANLMWYVSQGMVQAVFSDNEAEVYDCIDEIVKGTEISKKVGSEGPQADFSFHQHGQQFYTGYEDNFLLHCVTMLSMLEGTKYERNDQYSTYARLILDGYRWINHGVHNSPAVAGRGIAMYNTKYTNDSDLVKTCRRLADVYPEAADDLRAYADYLVQNNTETALVYGNKHFWCSNIMAHKRPGYSASVELASDKTINTECDGVQNTFGEYSSVGSIYLYSKDDAINPYFRFYDWAHFPGVTSPKNLEVMKTGGTFVSQKEKFAGGVSDGEYGASAMKLSKWHTLASKGYFFFDDSYVALGAGISTARDDISTTIDQRAKLSELYVDGVEMTENGEYELSDVSNVFENGIGYYFPNKENITLRLDTLTKSQHDVDPRPQISTEQSTQDMFVMWKNHTVQNPNDTYVYVVYPNTSREIFAQKIQDCSVKIISNTKDLQAVYNTEENVGYAVFYKAGSCKFSDGVTVEVNRPCILMMRENSKGGYSVSVSEPSEKYKSITVKLGTVQKSIELPQNSEALGEQAGKTVTMEF